MSYRLKNKENVAEGMRRIITEQSEKALKRLTARNGNRDQAIHDARVCFKKIRALLRLMRDQMGSDFQEENDHYRDLGRRLSSVRNNVGMIESLAKLKEQFGDQLAGSTLRGPRRPLVEANARSAGDKRKALEDVSLGLRGGRHRIARWDLGNDGFDDLAPGLLRTYKQGRSLHQLACRRPTVESLHEWRKRVKDLWYQVRVLKEIWPDEMTRFADELKELGDYLSDHHDLAMLRERSAGNAKQIDDLSEVATLIALIDQRAAELRLKATLLGGRIYAEKPHDFLYRLRHYWRAWKQEIKSQPISARASKIELSSKSASAQARQTT